MSVKVDIQPSNDRELAICRIIDAPREKVYRAWTDPLVLPHWFCPKPWSVARAEMDVRFGGSSNIVMRSPDGQEFPNPGVYLEVVPGRKLVFTDAFTSAWQPSAKPFMVGTVTLEDEPGGKTRYTARVGHWSVADREQHEKMGFYEGWGIAADQLEETVRKL
jgi:uncharacterized protein YndB with AHSA1/START domain